MKRLIDASWLKRLIPWAILIGLVKAGMLVLVWFLPRSGVDFIASPDEGFYQKYRIAEAFDLKPKRTAAKKEPVYQLSNLTLKALFDDKEHGFIAVEDGRKVTILSRNESYKGYKLVDILARKAIMQKQGKRYELTFKDDARADKSITSAAPELLAEPSAVFVKRDELKHYAKNFDQIWSNIKIDEVIENKRLKGFTVKWVKKNSVFARLGLRKGDLITGVNGKTFKSVSQVFKLYNNLDKVDSLKLKVIRNNEEKELEYEVY